MKLKLKRKAGETLAESVMALAIFGVVMLGLTDFMAGETNYIARTHYRDNIIYKAQEFTANNRFSELKENESFTSKDAYVWSHDKKVVTVILKDSTETLSFALP